MDELLNAVTCVLEALVVLHADPDPLYHRDIRWANVIQDAHVPTKWFLIDWDEASSSPTLAAPDLDPASHCPKVFEDGHAGEVDVWAVGMLLGDMLNLYVGHPIGADLGLLSVRMKGYTLSAADVLQEIRRIKSAVTND
ncbi:hypothetical protein SCHPADRAFT_944775 [Schizopora paradoxa]|uniref:Protein kinase domain-containing protein n=1 Tax=Schizopora paradoxa TaxID=27342 RepID=A0A0H2RES8_9AGAM|nr:hypothetical protein SCHPADRAFT_944775 [Schizopora paradoxa]